MFTEGLDEKAISWIKQGSEVEQTARPPLIEKFPLDPAPNSPLVCKTNSFLSPKRLPPVKFYSGLLVPHANISLDSEDEQDESVASVPEGFYTDHYDTLGEESLISSDSELFERPKSRISNDEMNTKTSHESVKKSDGSSKRTLVRGQSKENLMVDVEARFMRTNVVNSIAADDTLVPQGHLRTEFMHLKFEELQTPPSAPPILRKRRGHCLDVEDDTGVVYECFDVSSDIAGETQNTNEPLPRCDPGDGEAQIPAWKNSMVDEIPCFTTSVQSAWQTFVAYDACFRLCLNAWARNCMEAPEFLRDECVVLRNAFGLQKYLLQPKGQIQGSGSLLVDSKEGVCSKGRKVIKQIEVEVKKVRIIPRRRKLRSTYSQRAIYMQMGAEYVRHVSLMLKNQMNTLKLASYQATPEENLSCFLQLKSSSGEAVNDSPTCLIPGSGDSHVFCPESNGDCLSLEVQDNNKMNLGQANIDISSLADSEQSEIVRWWPLHHGDDGCIGKVQLIISICSISDRMNSLKGGLVVETLIYDLVLEAALRALHFNTKNLHICGIWEWLLHEFSDYYGVSDAYTKLRYLSCVMAIATPTKDCLDLIYNLLLPVIKARSDKSLNRQERSIFLDCEEQIKALLATTFENYKSLDESSPEGLTDMLFPIQDTAAPALVPAVQIFTLLYDVLSQEAQSVLRNYLQNAAAKRCRRHMVETDEFMSNNGDGFLTDPMTISTAYLKMKSLCANISNEIQADMKIHNEHILPSSIDLPNIAASIYSSQLNKRLRGFLAACPPCKPSPHVSELLIATSEFERHLDSWKIMPVIGGVVSRDLFHNYIMVWIQDTQLGLLNLCKMEKVPCCGILTNYSTSPFVETMYDHIRDDLNEYEVVINRWPQYLLSLENVVADVERAIMKAIEKQYNDILIPLRDGIPKMLEKQVQKFTRRQSTQVYAVPNQLGTFLNTVKRMLDVLHTRVEEKLKSWASYLTLVRDGNPVFGEQMNGIVVLLRKKYKKYVEAIVEKLISNTQTNRTTRLKRILEDTKEAEGEAEIRERMQALSMQLTDSIQNLHGVFSSRIFVAICRQFWDRMGQIVLKFLESRKENRNWYRGSEYALGVLDDLFASELQTLLGNSIQDKDLDPPRSVIEARSILC
ncbi:uncharacterized protein LOC120260571 isoform X2 [Dioscorea cayenensis subsp. rotundata]|uniref:Uncharacterized protein LOC120260571 isoform X2 n=1 Tax=Dioscorea cayennensis subsp. rotundata TaxID=55577 RepID=A0AB40BBH3_DIOCR|nr:uncharacterized protein LOC120260571 isoform X2 [Dioscorea cayenensis subsp. rotundata]